MGTPGASTIIKKTKNAPPSSSSLSRFIVQTLTTELNTELNTDLNTKLGKEMHATATAFSFFEHPLWMELFSALSKCKLPPPENLSWEMLDQAYNEVIDSVFDEIKSSGGGTFSINGATNNLAKSKSNVIPNSPIPLFTDYLKSDLNRETTNNVFNKVEKTMKRLDQKVGIRCKTRFV